MRVDDALEYDYKQFSTQDSSGKTIVYGMSSMLTPLTGRAPHPQCPYMKH
jgi:hypothetical protein